MLFGQTQQAQMFFRKSGKADLQWGVGVTAEPVTEGVGNWDIGAALNWHLKLPGFPKSDWFDGAKTFIGGGTAGAIGAGIINLTALRSPLELTFNPVFGGGFYTLQTNTLRVLTGKITVNNVAGAEIISGITGTSGLTKLGQYELRLPSPSAQYDYSGVTVVRAGILNLSGTSEFLPNSDVWQIAINFAATLATSGRMLYSNNPDLTGKTINLIVAGAAVGRWVAGTWPGVLGGVVPTFQVNGVTQPGVNIATPYFRYITATQVFFYQPNTGAGAGQINPAFGITNNWSTVRYDTVPGVKNFTVPEGVYVLKAWAVGAGGAGGGTRNVNNNGAGGGGGGGATWRTFNVRPGDVINYTVGDGGNGVVSAPGGAGGFSRVIHADSGTNMTANGGGGGQRHTRPPIGIADGGAGGAFSGNGDGGINGGRGGHCGVTAVNIQSGGSGGAYGNVIGNQGNLDQAGVNAANVDLINYALGLAGAAIPFTSGGGQVNGQGGNGEPGTGGGGAGAQNIANYRGGHGGNGFVLFAW